MVFYCIIRLFSKIFNVLVLSNKILYVRIRYVSLDGLLVKWLTHYPLKVTFMGSNPIQVTSYVIYPYL